jgi:signal peptidase II
VFVVITDQLSKVIIKGISIPFLNINFEGMQYGQSLDVLGTFFRITFVENPGMAFGISVGDTAKIFLSLFSLAAGIGIVIYMYKMRKEKFVVRFALALILGGAVGNLIDRTFYGLIFDYAPIFYGRVVDFLDVDFFDFSIFGQTYTRWPIFNIADSAVSVGVFLLLIFHNTESVNRRREKDNDEIETLINSDISAIPADVDENNNNDSDKEHDLKTSDVSGIQNTKVINGKNNNRENSNL